MTMTLKLPGTASSRSRLLAITRSSFRHGTRNTNSRSSGAGKGACRLCRESSSIRRLYRQVNAMRIVATPATMSAPARPTMNQTKFGLVDGIGRAGGLQTRNGLVDP